jgi:hypothetical protein
MDTNLLAIPLVSIVVETGNNEDWVDSLLFLVDSTDPTQPQLDLRGIKFEMEIRRRPDDHEVVIHATTDDDTLIIGDPPNFGYLIISVPIDQMVPLMPGAYVGDIRGTDTDNTRVIVEIALTVFQGVTR